MTYEENLRKTAEEISMAQYKKNFEELAKGSPFSQGSKFDPENQFAKPAIKSIAATLIPAAEYCLKKQAEAYRMGILMYGGSAAHTENEINAELKQLGLIP